MTSEQFIKANPTITVSKAINILKGYGFQFTHQEYATSGLLTTFNHTYGNPCQVDTQKVFDWISY
jgi:hypothetical protein